jgi:superfamily II DNA or RNA helicase
MAGNTREDGRSCKMTIATYSMLEEGYDYPTLDTLILCTPRSNIQQTIGRVEREHPDKDHPLVYDIVDNFSLFPEYVLETSKFL